MKRFIAILLGFMLLATTAAHAVTLDEIPYRLRSQLPEFLLYLINPQALAALSMADVEEIAEAYQAGEFYFINDVRVMESKGPLDPQLAVLILQVPRGAPYIEKRFIRLAKDAYGKGIFTDLQWEAWENSDGSVDLKLYYEAGNPEAWIPDISYSAVGGFLLGVKYQHLYHQGQDRQLYYGINFSEEAPEDPGLYASWTDSTINNGNNSYTVSASLRNEWRRRRNLTPAVADLRQRTGRVDGSYTWRATDVSPIEKGSITLGGGVYGQDHILYYGDPTAEGAAPRSDFDQAGYAGYLSLGWGSAMKNQSFTPSKGYSYSARVEQHAGDFDFSRFSLDLRRYIPVANILGHDEESVNGFGIRHDISKMFPAASLAFQAQVNLAEGDVPYSQEVRLGNSNVLRGYPYDYYTGTKLAALRAEYRFALDPGRDNELFLFTDHALLAENESDPEAFNTYGLGALFKVPIYGGFKLGAYVGYAYDGGEDSYGLSFGYQF